MIDLLVLPLALVLGIVLMALFLRVIIGGGISPRNSPIVTRRADPARRTYTEDEILLPGVDTRHPNVEKQIARGRLLRDNDATMSGYHSHIQRQMKANRAGLFDEPDEAPKLPDGHRPLPRSERSKRLLGDGR